MTALRWMLLGAVGVMTGAPAFAQTQHLSEAVTHVQAAVAQGKQGYPEALVKQAQEALKHVELAQGKAANVHLDEVIRLLKDAIARGRQGHVQPATNAAEEALVHLTRVAPAAPESPQGCGY